MFEKIFNRSTDPLVMQARIRPSASISATLIHRPGKQTFPSTTHYIIMSLRRKSCNACFRGRRKCNLAYPTCDYCRKTRKNCQYAYPPTRSSSDESPSSGAADSANKDTLTALLNISDTPVMEFLETGTFPDIFSLDVCLSSPNGLTSDLVLSHTPAIHGVPTTSIRKFLGPLGEVPPIQGINTTWQWLIDALKSYPGDFAEMGENIFIHGQLYDDSMPRSIRTTYGISSCSCLSSERNWDMMFRIIEAEVNNLLQPEQQATPSLFDDLANLQALLLYQIIRLFHRDTDIKQRSLAEQQGGILMTRALKLLSRSQAEPPTDRQTWIIAECIRRTAVVIYMLYGVNSIHREGICIGLPTLAKLPVSSAARAWSNREDGALTSETASGLGSGFRYGSGGTMPYEKFLECWLVSTPRRLEPFERLLLVPCQGLDAVEAFDSLADFTV
ncbi:hypothetical protein BDW74DRAFT_155201 [Aspergillus multicolor]|uniref:Zn(II)2Cys6 transcription factor domain-containing protein n=1 Tax=Aspergillus multicolor TaxID=41759 RepID=UPI003CCD06F2